MVLEKFNNLFLWFWVAVTYPMQTEDWSTHLSKKTDVRGSVLICRANGAAQASGILMLVGIACLGAGELIGLLGLLGIIASPVTYVAGSMIFISAILPSARNGPYPEMNDE